MIVPFAASEHLEGVNAWERARGVPETRVEMLPAVGFIEPSVAAGWLYLTDSAIALVENFVTNPAATKRARRRAVIGLAEAILQAARVRGVRGLKVTTGARGLGRIAIGFGCQYRGPCHVLTVEI